MFVTDFGDIKGYLLKNKGDAHMELYQYFKVVGLPNSLYMDNAKEVDVTKKKKNVLSEEGGIKTFELNLTRPIRITHRERKKPIISI